MSELEEVLAESQQRRAARAAEHDAGRAEGAQAADAVQNAYGAQDLPDGDYWRKAEREQAINRVISRAHR